MSRDNKPVALAPLSPKLLERLKHVSSGSLTTVLFRRGYMQCFLVGLRPMNPQAATSLHASPPVAPPAALKKA